MSEMVSWAKRVELPAGDATYLINKDTCLPLTEIPAVPVRCQSWSNEQFIAIGTKVGVEIVHLNGHVFKNSSKIESIRLKLITETTFNQNSDCQKFEALLTQYCWHALRFHQNNFQTDINHWTHEIFYSKLFLYFQTSSSGREIACKLTTFFTSQDDGYIPKRLEFWPNSTSNKIPHGGSILGILTRDYRLYYYQYQSANPPYWAENFEISNILRRHLISLFFDTNPIPLTDNINDDIGRSIIETMRKMAIIDFICLSYSLIQIEVIVLTAGASVYLVKYNMESGISSVAATLELEPENDPKYIHRLQDSNTFVVACDNGLLQMVHIMDGNLGFENVTSEENIAVSQMHSVKKGEEIFLFLSRYSTLQLLIFTVKDNMCNLLNDSGKTFETNSMPFLALRSYLNCNKVQCSAVTECGKVYLMEVNSLRNFYQRYSEHETAKIELDNRTWIQTACISPIGCTMLVSLEKENIFLKSLDDPMTQLEFYPIMQEPDYEPLLVDFVLRHEAHLLPILYDLIIQMKKISSDLIPTQKLLKTDGIALQYKFVLTKVLFSNHIQAYDDCVSAIEMDSARTFIRKFEHDPDFTDIMRNARKVYEKFQKADAGKYVNLEENAVIDFSETPDSLCSATMCTLTLSVYCCSCCSAYYNLFDVEEHPLPLRTFLLRSCNFCCMPKPNMEEFILTLTL